MTSASRWVVCFEPRPSAVVRLLCLHHAGAGASSFRLWSRELPDWIEVLAVQLPGREGRIREPLPQDLRAVAEDLGGALDGLLEPPFALFGHSMGALLGFELAHVLRARATGEPAHLFVGGYGAPHVYRGGTPLHEMTRREVVDHLRATAGAPQAVLDNRELLEFFVPIIQADVAMIAARTHAAGTPPLSTPISAFGGRADAQVPVAALRAWAQLSTGEFRLRMLDGGHHFPSSARDELLAALTRDLAERFAPRSSAVVP